MKPTLSEKLIAAIAYKNPDNDLIQNMATMNEVLKALKGRDKELEEILKNY